MSNNQKILGKVQECLGRELSVFEERSVESYKEIKNHHMKDLVKLANSEKDLSGAYLRFLLARPDSNMNSFIESVVIGGKDVGIWLNESKT